jgi:hypothetical protein
MSSKARTNWAVDVVIGIGFLLSALSGIALLLAPAGFQGGRNALYGTAFLFLGHDAWRDLHTWSSLVMTAGVGLHLALHLNWILCMTRGVLSSKRLSSRPAQLCPIEETN